MGAEAGPARQRLQCRQRLGGLTLLGKSREHKHVVPAGRVIGDELVGIASQGPARPLQGLGALSSLCLLA